MFNRVIKIILGETSWPKLYFRYSAMNAGKTTQLLQVKYNYEERGQKVLLIKPAIDNRYGAEKNYLPDRA